jgi:hypothetical protein
MYQLSFHLPVIKLPIIAQNYSLQIYLICFVPSHHCLCRTASAAFRTSPMKHFLPSASEFILLKVCHFCPRQDNEKQDEDFTQ